MIALAIVAITMSFAAASYRGYVQRSQRVEAMHALLAAAAEQEKFRLAHGRYGDRLDGTAGGDPPALLVASATPHGRYRLAVESADAAGFLIVALPDGGHADPLCARYSIDESGRRSASDREGRDSTARCW
ncbi:MAG TPA: type IV pilin protein [Steroidobacteraceae bacterium]|nr:type IV pilin protein [Steroidobacteraceae bacterium]